MSDVDDSSSVGETVSDESIGSLRLSKSKCKSKFTRTRHRLLNLTLDDAISSQSDVRALQEALVNIEEDALDVMERLLVQYTEKNDVDNAEKVQLEIDTMIAEFTDTLDTVQQRISQSSDKSTRRTSTSPAPQQSPQETHVSTLNADSEVFISRAASDSRPQFSSSNTVGQDLWRQLKRVSIPVFSGNKCSYEAWKAAFNACVDSAPMSAEYKLLQLRQYLSGDALKLIENLGHSAASYDAAKERLDRKFGGIRRHIALQLEEIDNFRQIRPGNAVDLDRFADLLDLVVINLKELGRSDELGRGSLYHQLLKKLDETLIASYQRWLHEQLKFENVESLRQFILQEAEFRTIATETIRGLSNAKLNPSQSQRRSVGQSGGQSYFGRATHAAVVKCDCCNGDHGIWKCKQFIQLGVADRWQLAKDKKLCFRCLASSHRGQDCSRSRPCGVNGCTQVHNRLLHRNNNNNNNRHSNLTSAPISPSISSSSSNHNQSTPATSSHTQSAARGGVGRASESDIPQNVTMLTLKNSIALRTVPVILRNGSKSLRVNALLDDGSTKTYINSDVAAELGLVGESHHISVSVLNGQCEVFDTMAVDVELQSLDRATSVTISAYTTNKVTGSLTAVDWRKHGHKWKHLQQIKFPNILSPSTIDLLIGLDNADLHLAEKEVHGKPGEPIARLTPLGWTCVGKIAQDNGCLQTNFIHTYFIKDEADISCTLRKFWEVEEVTSTDRPLSTDDHRLMKQAIDGLEETNGRYSVTIPWKKIPPILPNNYAMAMKRLENTEQRLSKIPDIEDSYCATIRQYENKGYIRKIKADEAADNSWFLPHFAVIRPDKSTTKTRIVFDASATFSGSSLNQTIHQGPKLQKELTDVLLRFRKKRVALVCDIAEMYLQVEMNAADRKYFRFLWRDADSSKPPDIYEFSRLVFGVNCSPFLAQFVAQQHAAKLSKEFPLAADTVLKSTYMDDSMDSADDEQQCIQLYRQLSELWKMAGMHTRKWLSNSDLVLAHIPTEDRAAEMKIDGEQLLGAKTLGIMWLAREDVFTFHFKPLDESFRFTKRSILKKVATLFDPLGFLAPYIIRAKILLQKLWVSGLDWDDTLSESLLSEAENWFAELHDLDKIQVPRCIRSTIDEKMIDMSLHAFADASSEAYGAVVYTRCVYESGRISCHLVCSKTRVSPLIATSIPRLELMAAVLAV